MTEPDAASSFEQSLAELQRIVAELESGSLGLEQSLSSYERGIGLLRQCHSVLERAEQKIELLTGIDASGNPTLVPFDATATAERQGKSAGRRSRKKPAKSTPAESPSEAGTEDPAPPISPLAAEVAVVPQSDVPESPPWESGGDSDTPSAIGPDSTGGSDDDVPRLF